jgi:Fe-S cluster assembly protein SufD
MGVQLEETINEETLKQIAKNTNEPEWALNLRLKGLEAYLTQPLPKLEKTKLARWKEPAFQPYLVEQPGNLNQLEPQFRSILTAWEQPPNGSLYVQRHASPFHLQAEPALQKQGVIFTDLHTAIREHEALVQRYLLRLAKPDDKLSGLHAALWSGGLFIYVPKNQHVELPLQALYLIDKEKAGLFPHVLIVVEENASLTYIEQYTSKPLAGSALHNGATEVYVGQGGKVRIVSIHQFTSQVTDYTFRHAEVSRDGSVEWLLGEMNLGDSVSFSSTVLKENGAQGFSQSIAIANGEQKASFTNEMIHQGMYTPSQITQRGVVFEEAQAVFNGITRIDKGAQKANGQQNESLLMLGGRSRGDANPILLIEEDDVQAGHGASVGQINDIQLYYLMSRGISRKEAERLIIHGFIKPIIDAIPLETVRHQLWRVAERKLGS